jgi:hypothetical protein
MDKEFYGTDIPEKNIVFRSGQTEMLRVGPEGFYVQGVKVEQGPNEAEAVYNAIKQMIMWDTLRR